MDRKLEGPEVEVQVEPLVVYLAGQERENLDPALEVEPSPSPQDSVSWALEGPRKPENEVSGTPIAKDPLEALLEPPRVSLGRISDPLDTTQR